MKMIVGLGNPGAEYNNTPHNVGFATMDILAYKFLGQTFKKKVKDGLVIEGQLDGEDVILVKPQTFMNNSGDCVFALAQKYRVEPKNICIILDDVDLTAGLCRVRPSGSAGTHNGLRSVTTRLGTTEFTRIRIGVDSIGREPDLATFVLKKMEPQLQENVNVGIDNAVKYVLKFIKGEDLADTK